ncbi:MAG: RrF2 family transcriptional regulator [Brevirhabdus sp.]
MRLTVRTNLAMRTLMYCGVHPGQNVRKSDVAKACHASENHLAQVINMLSHGGFIKTARGRNGGITLSRAPRDISLGEVFRTFEAGVPFTECFSADGNTCPLTPFCRLRGAICDALNAFYSRLDIITLHELIEGNSELQEFMGGAYETAEPAPEPQQIC